jgi:integrase
VAAHADAGLHISLVVPAQSCLLVLRLRRIIDASPEPWNICFAFMAYLGLRTGEAVGVAWENIDLPTGVLRVKQSNWRGKLLTVKSKSSNREQPLPPVLVDMLKGYQLRGSPTRSGCCSRTPRDCPLPVATCAGTSYTRYASGWALRVAAFMLFGMAWALR